MTAAQIKQAEDMANVVAKENKEVYARETALPQAKAIQGLRAVFDEVRGPRLQLISIELSHYIYRIVTIVIELSLNML